MNILMKCGHTANARSADDKPSCVICIGIHPGASIVDDAPPSLDGRIAKCSYKRVCKSAQPSNLALAFFAHHPNQEFDEYYCGCQGWD